MCGLRNVCVGVKGVAYNGVGAPKWLGKFMQYMGTYICVKEWGVGREMSVGQIRISLS